MAAARPQYAAIAGIGQTTYSRKDDRSELQLAAEAAKAALEDAGIAPSEVDGMITYTLDPVDEIGMIRCLGVKDLAFTTRVPGGGSAAVACVQQAAAAVLSGLCQTVVVWRSINQGANYRYGQPKASGSWTVGGGTGSLLWCMPFGAQTPATWGALQAKHYMDTYGVRNEDFGHIAVTQRKYASTNRAAIFFGKPITHADHQASKWIVEPVLRLLDCCQENSGAAALVVTSLDRAKHLKQKPARITAAVGSIPYEVEIISNYYHDDLTVMPEAVGTAKRLYAAAGLSPRDIDVAELYDAFTPHVMMQLEAFGLCPKGEGKDFVRNGNLDLTGSLPTNTHGGHGGEAYIHGMNFITESVRQVRGTAVNQAKKADNVLVSSGTAGAILSRV